MKKKPFKNSLDCLFNSDNGQVNNIIKKFYLLQALNEAFMNIIDERFKPYCRVGNYRDGIVVIMVDSSTWMTPLRFQAPELLSKLRRVPGLAGIAQIEFKVMPSSMEPEAPAAKPIHGLSSETAHYYESLADDCDSAELGEALRRLAKHRED